MRFKSLQRKTSLILTIILPLFFFVLFLTENIYAQQKIAHVQPDALGPGMTIAMEVLAPAKDSGAFGADGVYLPSAKILLQNPLDSLRVIFGPVVISWNGRVLQVPVMAISQVTGAIRFQILTGNKLSAVAAFELRHPQSKISISGDATLGDPSFAPFSFNGTGNTIVADEIEFLGTDAVNKGLYNFSTADTDTFLSGNPHYHPVTLLSRGPIHLNNAEITVSADSLNGGPGGGGGGHGWMGIGGAGYTGGGSDSNYSPANIGSGANSTVGFGGASSTGIFGGASVDSIEHHGGGGGTGCPYGSSGVISQGNDSSHAGGFGAGSAGGETPGLPFGGGGAAFAVDGQTGSGLFGTNFGHAYGGRFLVPMQGGSGGGAGNHVSDKDSTAGSGGGGGGALTLISYDVISLSSSSLAADGMGGTSGISAADAGGGGGSGGGVLLSARNGISLTNTTISTNGGSGGLGGAGIKQISKGGNGSFGRIRIDGDTTFLNSSMNGFFISGPIIDIPAIQLLGPVAAVTGNAGDSASLTDSIRIYFRNQHTSWSFVDTLRFKTPSGKYRWKAFLPLGHDSSLYVTVMAQLRNPNHSFANFEPGRLLSHLSSGVIRVVPTPHLVFEQDTLIFGCYKVGDTCVTANFYLSNFGEDSLHIQSITISNPNFSSSSRIDLGYYNSDSLAIKYCPKTVGKDTVTITFISKDTTRTAILIGCGIDKDTRITLKPDVLNFGRVQIGKCDTLKIMAHSVGKDSALIIPNGFTHPPFQILKPLKDTLLAPGDSLQIFISFCASDTGNFHSSFIFTEKRDSVIVFGNGSQTKKILSASADLQGKSLCLNTCDTITIHLFSIGNDAVVIDSIQGVTLKAGILPIRLLPQSDTSLIVQYCAVKKADTVIRIQYFSDADSSNETVLHYHGIQAGFSSDSVIHFSPICLPSEDSISFSIHQIGSAVITIDSLHLKSAIVFSLGNTIFPKTDSVDSKVFFTPITSGIYADTLIAFVNLSGCKDTIVKIAITGSASNGDLLFSKTLLSFGGIDTGSCKIDSIIVFNPCGNSKIISIPPVAPPFFIISPVGNILTVASSDSSKIIYRYCPTTIGKQTALQIFSLPNISDSITLSGTGLPIIDSPFVRFSLGKVIATAGQTFSYLVSVDSISSGTSVRSLKGRLTYDPTLIEPLSMTGITWKIFNNSETTPGIYHFSANNKDSLTIGAFATLQMLALYGAHDTTSVFLDSIGVSNYASTAAIPGFIQVVHCGNLPGNISVAAAYALGDLSPNPATGNISFPVILGNDGVLRIRMYNASGMSALERSMTLKRGENTIILDVTSLPSGVYYLSADSWGWRDGKTLIIQK